MVIMEVVIGVVEFVVFFIHLLPWKVSWPWPILDRGLDRFLQILRIYLLTTMVILVIVGLQLGNPITQIDR
jgi:hypothetical protein